MEIPKEIKDIDLTEKDTIEERREKILKAADNYAAEHASDIYLPTLNFSQKIEDNFNLAEKILQQTDILTLGELHNEQANFKYLIDNLANFKRIGVVAIIFEGLFFNKHESLLNEYFANSDYRKMPIDLYDQLYRLDIKWKYYSVDKFNSYSYVGLVVLAKQLNVRIVAVEDRGSASFYELNQNPDARLKMFDYLCFSHAKAAIEKGGKALIRAGFGHAPGISGLTHGGSIIVKDINVFKSSLQAEIKNTPTNAIIYLDPRQKSKIAIQLEADCKPILSNYKGKVTLPNAVAQLFSVLDYSDYVTMFKKKHEVAKAIAKKKKIVSSREIYIPIHMLLYKAIKLNRYQIVNYLLLETAVDINYKYVEGQSILHLLLRKRVDIFLFYDKGLQEKILHIIGLIISRDNIDLNAKDNNGETPLHIIAKDGSVDDLDFFIARKNLFVDFNCQNKDNRTPLHIAAKLGKLEIIKKLFQCAKTLKLDIDAQDKESATALHLAVKSQRMTTVEFLVKNGANVNARDINGCTPLHVAACVGNIAQIKLLLAVDNVQINMEDYSHKTALHYAKERMSESSNHKEIVDLLKAHKKMLASKTPPSPAFFTAEISEPKSESKEEEIPVIEQENFSPKSSNA